jgi:RNA polymerase sigma-70 factor (ECF subfamily)
MEVTRLGGYQFPTTRWSLVRHAFHEPNEESSQALASLCGAYWFPLYAYVRRSGKSSHDAEDLVQGFFEQLLQTGSLAAADRERGKLRTFLLTCLRNYLSDHFDRANTAKRGGRMPHFSLDEGSARARYDEQAVDTVTPEELYQRQWALTILEHALQQMKEEFTARDEAVAFEVLRPFLGFGMGPEHSYEEASRHLGMSVGTVKSRVFRLRQRWRDILFDEVGRTLGDPDPQTIREELKSLIGYV